MIDQESVNIGQLKATQRAMLQALREHRGLVTYASKASGVGRSTHYDWMRDCPEYKQAVDEIKDFVLDEIEHTAMSMITDDKNPAVTIFYLKTLGKTRGFVEKQEIEHSMGDMTSFRQALVEAAKEYEREY